MEAIVLMIPRPKMTKSAILSRVGRGMRRMSLSGRTKIQMSIRIWNDDVAIQCQHGRKELGRSYVLPW